MGERGHGGRPHATGVPDTKERVMFATARKNPGFAGLLAVVLVIAGYLAGVGFVWKTYVDAGEQPAAVEQCRVVCGPAMAASDTNG